VGNVLEQEGLAGLGRRHDEPALTAADGRDEVDDPLREVVGAGLQVDELVREYGGELLEVGPALGDLRVDAVDGFDAQQAVVALIPLGGANGAGHVVACAEAEAAHLGLGDVNVAQAGKEVFLAQKAVAIVDDLEDASPEDVALALGLGLENAQDKVLLAQSRGLFDVEVGGDRHHLVAREALEFGHGIAAVLLYGCHAGPSKGIDWQWEAPAV